MQKITDFSYLNIEIDSVDFDKVILNTSSSFFTYIIISNFKKDFKNYKFIFTNIYSDLSLLNLILDNKDIKNIGLINFCLNHPILCISNKAKRKILTEDIYVVNLDYLSYILIDLDTIEKNLKNYFLKSTNTNQSVKDMLLFLTNTNDINCGLYINLYYQLIEYLSNQEELISTYEDEIYTLIIIIYKLNTTEYLSMNNDFFIKLLDISENKIDYIVQFINNDIPLSKLSLQIIPFLIKLIENEIELSEEKMEEIMNLLFNYVKIPYSSILIDIHQLLIYFISIHPTFIDEMSQNKLDLFVNITSIIFIDYVFKISDNRLYEIIYYENDTLYTYFYLLSNYIIPSKISVYSVFDFEYNEKITSHVVLLLTILSYFLMNPEYQFMDLLVDSLYNLNIKDFDLKFIKIFYSHASNSIKDSKFSLKYMSYITDYFISTNNSSKMQILLLYYQFASLFIQQNENLTEEKYIIKYMETKNQKFEYIKSKIEQKEELLESPRILFENLKLKNKEKEQFYVEIIKEYFIKRNTLGNAWNYISLISSKSSVKYILK